MIDNPSLVADLVAWVAKEPRRYEEVMEGWRTSCPRLTIWEDAVDHGYLAREHDGAGKGRVVVTRAGLAFIRGAKGH
jgi:hypothetical protein